MGLLLSGGLAAEELPVPTLQNSIILSLEHPVTDAAEVAYIKSNFPWGLYTRLSFSRTVLAPRLAWKSDWNNAASGIQAFKTEFDNLLTAADSAGVYLHVVLCSGLARLITIYRDAKIEDIRNAQWYNDNKISSDAQLVDPDVFDKHVFGTLSRYARKMRRNLEAKAKAGLAFIKQRMDEKPHVLAAISGWGEAELNFGRLNPVTSVQEWFCDYSPFAILEFRDWIRHTGMYDTVSGTYPNEGWAAGGARYHGPGGLAQFNADFGTAFTSWDLKYWNWSLLDDWDQDPTDGINNDPGRIPYAAYVHGGMMPGSGPGLIPGGFDPPRVMAPGIPYWDLWNLFRETMVRNFVLDMARWSAEAGIPSSRWYSHQVPADYLFGTNPSMENKNARYYSSASPLWTANVVPFGEPGATIYDVKFPTWFARTSQYVLPPLQAMSSSWAALEYDAEAYPQGQGVPQSSVNDILNQYLKIYRYSPHFINFWRWMDATARHQIKGMNKEAALREFISRIRDKARRSTETVFTPPRVADISGAYDTGKGGVRIETNGLIWTGQPWTWKDWGDFSRLEVHRGTVSGFSVGTESLIGMTTEYLYHDATTVYGKSYYYRLRAVNAAGQTGPASEEVAVFSAEGPAPALGLNRTRLNFGSVRNGTPTSPQAVVVSNRGTAGSILNWTATSETAWLEVSPGSGQGGAVLDIRVNSPGLEPGTYAGRIRVEAAALYSPQYIDVRFDVYAAGSSKAPYGVFDTPSSGAVVYGAIPVTGWALDDVEVVAVDILRSPHSLDPPGAVGGDGLVFISQAIFVEGARPDVEPHFPNAPWNYRAGWGYMLLTNMLPDQGNGSFTIHAFARDREGTRVKLGEKTVTGNNAGSVKPFGTIDAPGQGERISGAAFNNFGWALTPQPKMIPTDGSTLRVWVDGVSLGRPAYNYARPSLAAMFPGLANTSGPVGLYVLDTTAHENGVHTIAWSAVDSGGNAEGLGSRFFTVLNLAGGSEIMEEGTVSEAPAASLRRHASRDFTKGEGAPASADQVLSLPPRLEPLGVRQGYVETAAAAPAVPDTRGVVRLTLPEVERIAIELGGEGAVNSGFLMVGEELRPLPIGSTLNLRSGVFSWQPGPGFLGEYTFIFIRKGADGIRQKTTVLVEIRPRF